MLSFIPRDGASVRDPRITPMHGMAADSDRIKGTVFLDETDPVSLQLLRHVRRGELLPGDRYTAALAGVPFTERVAAQPVRKGEDQ